jgi:hypothetical protein
VSSIGHDDVTVERFAPNGGQVVAVLGGLVVAGFLVGWALEPDEVPLWVPGATLLGGVVLYTSTVRPRVLVQGHDLVLRNMLSTVFIPLASIEELAVRQVLAVRAGGKRYVCAGVGRSLRQAMRGSAVQKAREQMGGLRGELAAVREPGMNYADYVEIRLQELIKEDRARRGIAKFSDEAEALARQARRELAWPEIAALVVTGVFTLVALFVA